MKDTAGKIDLTLVPPSIEVEIAKVREYGVRKYKDRDNWMNVSLDKYFQALLRHIHSMREDGIFSFDKESGFMHLSHAACNIAFLLELNSFRKFETFCKMNGCEHEQF